MVDVDYYRKFSVKLAWDFVRQGRDSNEHFKHIWLKGLSVILYMEVVEAKDPYWRSSSEEQNV